MGSIAVFVRAFILQSLFVLPAGFSKPPGQLYYTTLEPTHQELLPHCFGYFENLYYEGLFRNFVAIGCDIDLEKAIYTPEKRYYTWASFPSPPLEFRMYSSSEVVPGTTIITFELNERSRHFYHFYHCLEHLLGIWNFGGEEKRDEVGLFIIAGNGYSGHPMPWEANDISDHLIKALFPKAKIRTWEEFVKEHPRKLFCFEKMITSDRAMDCIKSEPYRTERMLGAYFQSLKKESTERFVQAVYEYAGVEIKPREKKIVTYIKRNPPRCLAAALEKELLSKIKKLSHIELQVVDFANLTFKEQINIAANTDVLLGVHGNGMSHVLFLPPTATVIELFPLDCFRVEYRIFAQSRGLHYFGFIPSLGWIDESQSRELAWFGDDTILNKQVTSADIDTIISMLQKI